MNIKTQNQFLEIYKQYLNTNRDTIAMNLKNTLKKSNLFSYQVMNRAGINMHTFNSMKTIGVPYKPDLIKLILVANELKIPVTDLFKPVEIEKKDNYTKWNLKAKKQFIEDYKNLDIEGVMRLYGITERTAGEYYRRFKEEIRYLQEA